MEQHFYCSVNTKWMNAVSKDDVVEVNVNVCSLVVYHD